jgi:hypothetical protein
MKKTIQLLAAGTFMGMLAGAPLGAETVGYVTITIPPGSIGTPTTTVMSIPFRDQVADGFVGAGTGTLTAVSSTSVTNSGAGWTAGFVTSSTPHFVRLTSGAGAGRTFRISSNTATVLNLTTGGLNLVTLGVVAGDSYAIFPAETLNTTFNRLSILKGSSAANADNVLLFNGSAWNTYFFNESANRWQLGVLPTDQGNTVISPDTGVLYVRRGSEAMKFLAAGIVPETNLATEISNGTTFLGGLLPINTTLGSLSIQNTPGWVAGTSATGTDKVMLFNGTTWNSYYYNSTASQWRLGALPTNQNNVAIATGAPVLVTKATPAGGSNTYTRSLPY